MDFQNCLPHWVCSTHIKSILGSVASVFVSSTFQELKKDIKDAMARRQEKQRNHFENLKQLQSGIFEILWKVTLTKIFDQPFWRGQKCHISTKLNLISGKIIPEKPLFGTLETTGIEFVPSRPVRNKFTTKYRVLPLHYRPFKCFELKKGEIVGISSKQVDRSFCR